MNETISVNEFLQREFKGNLHCKGFKYLGPAIEQILNNNLDIPIYTK